MKTSFYFAHPVTMYNTGSEKQIAERFRAARPETQVENPNQPQHTDGYKREGMDYFVKLCNRQDGVFFATHADGSVGAGVAKEIKSFLDRGAPVFYFNPKQLAFQSLNGPNALAGFLVRDVDSTRALLRNERALQAEGKDPYKDLETFSHSIG